MGRFASTSVVGAAVDGHSATRSSRVVSELLDRVGFTNHAIERFASRAQLGTDRRDIVEPIMRGLLLGEGRVVLQRPAWARSRNHADLYLQLGEWMLFIGCKDHLRDGCYAIVTVVNGPSDNTWQAARRRGYIAARPPLARKRRPRLLVTIVRAVNEREDGEGLLAAIGRTHSARRRRAQADYERAIVESWGAGTTIANLAARDPDS
jgi:hypothetical protein